MYALSIRDFFFNFKKIEQRKTEQFIKTFKQDIEKIKPSFFEVMTVLALWHFKQQDVDIAILETGLGGRLDSVTACDNKYVLFTSISLDHIDILGDTIEKIAKEKAAIAPLTAASSCLGRRSTVWAEQEADFRHRKRALVS